MYLLLFNIANLFTTYNTTQNTNSFPLTSQMNHSHMVLCPVFLIV